MSATGSGISEIFGFTLAAGGAAGSQVNFTHNLGTRAIQVYCCDAVTGRQLDGTEISVAQPTANVVQIANVTTGAVVVNISIRWQYDTVELDTVPTTDARLATAVGPPPVAVGIAGGGALNQVTYWTGAATIAGNALLTTDPATGDLDRIKNVPYDWPAANAAGVLTNDGAGNLTWAAGGGGMAIGGAIAGATQGSVLFAGAAGVLAQDNANFFWDDTNNRLGLLTTAPGNTLDIRSDGTAATPVISMGAVADPNTGIFHPAADALAISAGGNERIRFLSAAALNAYRIDTNIGTFTTDGERGMGITGTMLAGAANAAYMFVVSATGAGAGAGNQVAMLGSLTAGYTGAGRSLGVWGANASVGPAPTAGDFNNVVGTFGMMGQSTGAGAGYNFGVVGNGIGSNGAATSILAGGYFRASTGFASGTSIGVIGVGGSTGAGPTRIGGFFANGYTNGADGGTPTLAGVDGAVVADSVYTAAIFRGRNNATDRFMVMNTGITSILIDGTAAAPVLYFGSGGGDPNTGIFHPAADTLAFSTNGTEAMRIISTGEIGIGNAITPLSNQMIRVERNTNAEVLVQITNSTNGTAAAATLQVVSEGTHAMRLMEVAAGNTNASYTFAAGHSLIQAGNVAGHNLYLNAINATGNIIFVAGGTTESGRVHSSGNVSFGTTSDLGALAVDNGAVAESILVLRDNGTTVVTVADGGDTGIGVTPTEKLSLKDHTAFAGSETQLTTGAVQTTNATATVVKSLTLADNTLYWFEADIIGRDTTGTDRAYYKVAALFYRQGGGAATLEGAVASVITAIETAGAAAWNGTLAASGNNVVVNVTGAAATTINWTCTIRYQAVSGNA